MWPFLVAHGSEIGTLTIEHLWLTGAAMLIALAAGMPIRWNAVMFVLVPGAFAATALIALAMGWIFMSFGRMHRRPAGMAGAVVAMALAILELLTLIFLMIHAGGAAGLGM